MLSDVEEGDNLMLMKLTPVATLLTFYMSWWRWMVSDSNKFVLIRSECRGSVGKQLVLRTAST